MRILVTSFEPFGGDKENASEQAMSALLRRWRGPAELVGVRLSVIFDEGALLAAVTEHRPDLVVCLGEAGRRQVITPEAFGVNEIAARIPDNAGRQPDGEIVSGGADTLASKLDVAVLVEWLRQAGWAAEVSTDAGRYVCNFVTYHAYRLDMPAVFIHVPAVRSTGQARVGAETDGLGAEPQQITGRTPRSAEQIADALLVVLTRLAVGTEPHPVVSTGTPAQGNRARAHVPGGESDPQRSQAELASGE